MREEGREVDDIMCNMVAYCISGADIAINVLYQSVRSLLDQDLTKEQKKALKNTLNWEQDVMKFLGQVKKNWDGLNKAMEQLNLKLGERLVASTYDDMMADTNEVLAVMILYMEKAVKNPQAVKDIHEYLINYGGGTAPDVKKAYRYFQKKSKKI